MGSLVKDLNDLELNGVTLSDGNVYKGTLCAIAGDNLGSHSIGGFVENFSKSSHFCRYCEITRDEFNADPLNQGNERTKQSYSDHVQTRDGQSSSSGGVKFNSLFNTLTYFHVCQPGLPLLALAMIFLKVLYPMTWHCTLTILLRWINCLAISC